MSESDRSPSRTSDTKTPRTDAVVETLWQKPNITDRDPAGYVATLDDKNAPNGFWFVGAYHDPETALLAAAKQQGGRVVPFYFATDAEYAAVIEAALKDERAERTRPE